ncbi:DoxX family membrane protein [Nonomuraea terrae]|uniref:DoxX family membrane protein n=1 Tax=Nonomuraea terrae TaxID=2530383 RepID=A0A4R4YPW3_9ACTN|nr:DoxX family membrane protein [Nonomuraea terrae]TDD46179.1 DoxX family membrane protein [Nonomuraea terrae]
MAATVTRPVIQTGTPAPLRRPVDPVWAVARISLGWVFLWAFLDKTFGWGFATPAERAWVAGGSPTSGFLKGTQENALGGLFGALAGQVWVDWLFMAGLLGVGLALMLGVGLRIAAVAGPAMMVLMWAAQLPLDSNPFMDDHLVYAVVIVGLALADAGATLGLGRLAIVRRNPVLK